MIGGGGYFHDHSSSLIGWILFYGVVGPGSIPSRWLGEEST